MNEGPACRQCDGHKPDCPYCQGQGHVESLEQWIARGCPRTTKEQERSFDGQRRFSSAAQP